MNRSVVLAALFLLACSSSGGGGDDPGNASDAATPTGPDADTRAGEAFTTSWGPYDVEPGVEDTKCMIRRLYNDREIRVGKISNELGTVSHHFIVYRITEGEVSAEPFDCEPFADVLDPSKGAPLMVTQKSEEVLQLPEGVAFTFQPNQLVRLELHYLNATADTQTVQVDSTFTTVSEADFQHEADFLFVGNPDISLPPGASTLGPVYLPLPADLVDTNVFGITGHTHQWGTDVRVGYQVGEGGTPRMLYEVSDFNWEEPPTIMLDPFQAIAADSGFSFECSWDNQSGETVEFGESVNEEMCFFWAYYYPSKGAKVCVHSDQAPDIATDVCCPGDSLCALLDGLL